VIDDLRIDRAFADGLRDFQVEDEIRDHVEGRREHDGLLRLQHPGRHDGGDRVRRVVEAVHEVEYERDEHQRRDHP